MRRRFCMRCLLVLVLPFEQIGHAVGIVTVGNELRQVLAGKLFALAAMLKTFGGGALVDVTLAPENLAVLVVTAAAMEFVFELAGRAVRSTFALDYAGRGFVFHGNFSF